MSDLLAYSTMHSYSHRTLQVSPDMPQCAHFRQGSELVVQPGVTTPESGTGPVSWRESLINPAEPIGAISQLYPHGTHGRRFCLHRDASEQ